MSPRQRTLVPTLAPGTRLGDFVVETPIGEGGAGKVYRARQESLGGRVVALKVLPLAQLDARAREDFQREALAAAELHHPNLAEVYGFGLTDEVAFYAMRLVEGPTLQQVLERLAERREEVLWDPGLRRRIVRRVAEIASALAQVHARGMVHRDVKPGNVVLAGRGSDVELAPDHPAVLVDFGLVRAARAGSGAEELYGTPAYMAPDRVPDARSDVFALGVALHDLLAARPPDRREPPGLGLEPIEALVPGIDRDLAAIVGMARDPDPRWRYADAGTLERDLRAWLSGGDVRARRPRLPERAVRWVRRHPLVIPGAVAAAVAIVAVTRPVAGALGWLEAARQARAASATGDLLGMGEGLLAVPDPAAVVLFDARLRWIRGRLGEEDSALRAVYYLLATGEVSDAVVAAVDHLMEPVEGTSDLESTDRGRERARLVEFLGAAVRGDVLGRGDPRFEELRRTALVQCAYLGWRHPDVSPEEARASEPIRAALVDFLPGRASSQGEGSPPLRAADVEGRILATTALAGLGTLDEVGPLVTWGAGAADRSSWSEERRISLVAAGRILARAQAIRPGPLRVDEQQWWPECADWIRWERGTRPVGVPDAFRSWNYSVTALLAQSLLLAQRRAGGPPILDELLLPGEIERLTARPLEGEVYQEIYVLAAQAGDWRARAWLEAALAESDPPKATENSNVTAWGRHCGYLDDAVLTARAREVLGTVVSEHDGWTWNEEDFDRGVRMASDALEGRVEREPPVVGRSKLPCAPIPRGFPWHKGEQYVAMRSGGALVQWIFTCRDPNQPVGSSNAYFATLHDAARGRTDEVTVSVQLRNPGRSALALEFELSESPRGDGAVTWLYQRERNDILPFTGEARVDVLLDGESLGTGVALPAAAVREQSLYVPVHLLAPGPHRLEIRLSAESTSGVRLYNVWIE